MAILQLFFCKGRTIDKKSQLTGIINCESNAFPNHPCSSSAAGFCNSRTIDRKSQSNGNVLGDQCSSSSLDCESNAFPTPLPHQSHDMNVGSSSDKKCEFKNAFERPADYRNKSSQVGKKHKKRVHAVGIGLTSLDG